MAKVRIRNLREEDFPYIRSVINEWFGGRQVADLVHRFLFQHFRDTGFVAEEIGKAPKIVGFLVGFVSQTHPEEAYIHLVGVAPSHRGQGLGRGLYERFFEAVGQRGCRHVRSVTAPVNTASIQFHRRMGFVIEPGDATTADGIPVHSKYSGNGEARVCLVKDLRS
jgi:ribosomal protein S18 acetylase RimI-like enzyme